MVQYINFIFSPSSDSSPIDQWIDRHPSKVKALRSSRSGGVFLQKKKKKTEGQKIAPGGGGPLSVSHLKMMFIYGRALYLSVT